MKGSAVLYSKASDEWQTPRDFYDRLFDEFDFYVDAAASSQNALCPRYYGLDGGRNCRGDALSGSWAADSAHWLNPPYSQVRVFMAKAAAERERGVLTVALVPARTDTRWFHDYLYHAPTNAPRTGIELRFVKGRLKFTAPEKALGPAPFPSMVVIFRP